MTIRGRAAALFLCAGAINLPCSFCYPEIILDVCAEYFHNGVI